MNATAERQAEAFRSRLKSDPSAAHGLMAAHFRELAAQMHGSGSQVPGGQRSTAADLVRSFEQMAELWTALAEGREPPKTAPLGDTFLAKSLCDHALAPWNELTLEQQREQYQAAVELDPACAYVRLRYAMFLRGHERDLAEAERHLDVAVMLDDTYDEARLLLAAVLLQQGKPQHAILHIGVLESRLGTTAPLLTLRGYAQLGFARADLADEAFVRALEIAPRDVAAHVGRARALRALGDVSQARRHEQSAQLFAGERSPRPTSVSR